MMIGKNSVVTLRYQLHDLDGNIVDSGEHPLTYLHGGYDGIFPLVEDALEGKAVGARIEVRLEPEDAFGDYDAELVRVEPRTLFPSKLSVGMQFEAAAERDSEETLIYTVTDIADEKVVVDGNHPLAGKALEFKCTVLEVRDATEEEVDHGHVHGEHDHLH